MSEDKKAPTHTGEGIRSIKTTNVFRIVNFELYAKPNIVVMAFGLTAMAFSAAYLAYLKSTVDTSKTYVAIGDDGNECLMQKRSKWD